MNRVLALLLAFCFAQVQSYALVGGPPPGSGGSSFPLGGTYAGVLIPRTATSSDTSSAIGLFSIGVPATGAATGAAVVFINGTAYNGEIAGVADPDRSTLQGIVEAVSNFSIAELVPTGAVDANGNPVFATVQTNIFAQGNIDTTIAQEFDPVSSGGVQISSGIRISGTASLDLFSTIDPNTGNPIIDSTVIFDVDGFLQSSTVTTTTITITLPSNNNNNNNNNNGTGT